MSFCRQCGLELSENASFCAGCGYPVEKKEETANQNFAFDNGVPDYQKNFYEKKAEEQASNQSYNPNPSSVYKVDIPKRDIAICLLLTFVTCGIYGIYWYFCLINDLNVVAPDENRQGPGMVVLLTILTCGIYGYFWLYKAGQRLDTVKRMNGEAESNFGTIFIILALVQLSIADYCLIQNELNKYSNN